MFSYVEYVERKGDEHQTSLLTVLPLYLKGSEAGLTQELTARVLGFTNRGEM